MSDQTIETKIEDLRQVVLDINSNMIKAFKVVDTNFEGIQKRLDIIDGKVNLLSQQSANEFGTVSEQLKELKVEVVKIQKVSGYTEQYEKPLKISK